MDKRNKNILVTVLIVLAVVGVAYLINSKNNKENSYSVVYMSTGEVYVGKLTTFPDFELRDAYLYQVAKDDKDQTKANFQLQPVKDALWAPKSMHLMRKNIIFYGELMPDSKIAETLAAQAK